MVLIAGDAVAGYVQFGRTWVVAGAPVCEESRLEAVADELEAAARRARCSVLYFGAGSRLERVRAASRQHSKLLIGAQPVWNPRTWNTIVQTKPSLRAQLNRARNKGVVVSRLNDEKSVDPLRNVLNEWLSFRGLPRLAFLVEPDLFGDLSDRRVFVATQGERVVAFLVATPVPARRGWLVEEWPRVRNAPNGTTHLLVDAAMRSFAQSGAFYATLGLAPLSAHAGDIASGQPRWLQLALLWLRAHGTRFYNFRGLEAFKAGMAPDLWEPIYVIAGRPQFPPLALRAIAGAFSNGSPELLVARGVAAAVGEELGRLTGRLRSPSARLRTSFTRGSNEVSASRHNSSSLSR